MLLVMGTGTRDLPGNALCGVLSYTGIDLSIVAGGVKTFGLPRVIYPVVRLPDVILANVVVFVLGLLVSAYPAVKASRFTPVKAMAHT